jgi:uncharacterized protein with FMN-binding domain
VLLFVLVIVLIHFQHTRMKVRQQSQPLPPVDVDRLRSLFPDAQAVTGEASGQGRRDVVDSAGRPVGYILQTSPGSDHLIGFSGPTNVLIAFGLDDRIVGTYVLSSGDTRDHVAQVVQDELFMSAFTGLSRPEVATRTDVDAVSGATLTSFAIQESIIHRLSGSRTSLRFSDPLTVDDAVAVFDLASSITQDPVLLSLWYVKNERGDEIGSILRTSPFADNIIGFQGPTETRICFDSGGQIVGIAVGPSYDNEEYVTYVREDEYFLTLFNDLSLDDLASLDLQEAEVEGVSGATMTSMAIADGLIAAAEQHRRAVEATQQPPKPLLNWTLRDLGTASVIVVGLIISLTSLRGNKSLRFCFQLVLIGYLGLINGDMLSQAMIVGWARNGVPWSSAGGLVLLTCAALLVPISTRRNAYCTHLCPHGAAQHLLKDRLRWRLRLPRWMVRGLKVIPALLLIWCLIVAMTSLSFSLVDIEPFDAWVFRVAGWATITIAVVGLVASLFVPMAYCRYGCPTGAMLNFLRYNARSDRWSRRDWFALALVVLAAGICVAS